jgi:REP element-mobilizing transposase RayT
VRTALFVTFSTAKRWVLPESVRQAVLEHCLHDHLVKFTMHGVVVMPDHVHLVFTPLCDKDENPYGLAEIMNSIKGASAHSVNKILGRRGHVWQDESFDHILRRDESVRAKVEYICANPLRKGLGLREDDYPWLWREWAEGAKMEPQSSKGPGDTAEGGCATGADPAHGGSS